MDEFHWAEQERLNKLERAKAVTVKLGSELQVGDTIETWWRPGRDTIVSLRPYTGPLAYLWKEHGGARLADFAILRTGMTIEPQIMYNVISSISVPQ